MRLRPSMKKFEVRDVKRAEIEIVQPFGYPINAYLNRCLLFTNFRHATTSLTLFLRQIIVVLEDRKISSEVFLDIQADALADIDGAQESIETACRFLYANGLGWGFGLRYVLDQLGKLGFDLKKRPEVARIDDDPADSNNPDQWVLNNRFMLSTLKFAEFQVLRDIKHRARIPVKDSYVLVGVADEGAEYRKRKITKIDGKKIYCLSPDNIFGTSPRYTSSRICG
jgi:RNA-dependent RNA polymerase